MAKQLIRAQPQQLQKRDHRVRKTLSQKINPVNRIFTKVKEGADVFPVDKKVLALLFKTIPRRAAKPSNKEAKTAEKPKTWSQQKIDDWNKILTYRTANIEEEAFLKNPSAKKVSVEIKPSKFKRISVNKSELNLSNLQKIVQRRMYGEFSIGARLADKIKSLFETKYDADDLNKSLIITDGEGKQVINIYDWFSEVFKEGKPDSQFKNIINKLELEQSDMSTSPDHNAALKAKKSYAKENFYEMRTELALEYLKSAGTILDYKATKKNSYLDELGIDIMVRAKINGERRIFFIQVKGSETGLKEFANLKKLARYNFKKGLALDELSSKQGILVLRVDRSALSYLADRISKVVLNEEYRDHNNIKTVSDFDFSKDNLMDWISSVESTVIKQ